MFYARGLIAFLVVACTAMASLADVIVLQDGSRLRCEVLDSGDSPEGYLRIRVQTSVLLLREDLVDRIDRNDDTTPQDPQLMQRLLDEGAALSTTTTPAAVAAPPDEPLVVKSVRGWAYLSSAARETESLAALNPGDPVPVGRLLKVSANSRLTLEIAEMGEIGLMGGAELRFEEIEWDQSTQFYSINIRLQHGGLWTSVGQDPDTWRRVRLSINSVDAVLQNARLYAQMGDRVGAVSIIYLDGPERQKFWGGSGQGPTDVLIGQMVESSPNSSRLTVRQAPGTDTFLQVMDSWADWQPEPLPVSLDAVIPPLMRYPVFGKLPALYPYRIPIDRTIAFPPETRSLGEIIEIYRKAIQEYRIDTGRFPDEDLGVSALLKKHDVGGWSGPYVDETLPLRDTWGSPFVYELITDDGETYASVRSMGPNRKDDLGLGDDVR